MNQDKDLQTFKKETILPDVSGDNVIINEKQYEELMMYRRHAQGFVVEAYDDDNNTFLKYVCMKGYTSQSFNVVRKTELKKYFVVSFMWPAEYRFESLGRDFPFTKPLCIDAMGRNHRGHSVYIKADDVNKAFLKFVDYIEDPELEKKVRDYADTYYKEQMKKRIKENLNDFK